MSHRQTKFAVPALLAAISLIGCGEGNLENSTGNGQTPPKAGEAYTTSILVNDKPVRETLYTIYSVADDQGTITNEPLPDATQEAQRPHLLIKQSTSTLASVDKDGAVVDLPGGLKKLAPPIPLAKIQVCYTDIWRKLKTAKPDATRQELAMGIAQFGVTIDDLCTYANASGISLDEYVELFQTATKYFPGQPNFEADMVQFFITLNVTPKTFITALQNKGYTWEDFIKRIAANKGDVYGFINGYQPSGLALEPYLHDYMSRPGPVARAVDLELKLLSAYLAKDVTPGFLARVSPARVIAQNTTNPTIAQIDAGIKVVEKGFELSVKIWKFLKENIATVADKANHTTTSVLSKADSNTMNYAHAKYMQSPKVSFVGKRMWWENYRVDFSLDAYYDAKNTSAPGQWLPKVLVHVNKIQADWGYKLEGDAEIAGDPVNMGSQDAPIPEIQVTVKMAASNWSIHRDNTTFIVNGATGVRIRD